MSATNPTERPEERADIPAIEKRLEDGPIGSAWYEEVIHTLINEVKYHRKNPVADLESRLKEREEPIARQDEALQVLNARLDEAEDAERRVEQMEEALREAAETFAMEGLSQSAEMCRAALSPSDTEEEAGERDSRTRSR